MTVRRQNIKTITGGEAEHAENNDSWPRQGGRRHPDELQKTDTIFFPSCTT